MYNDIHGIPNYEDGADGSWFFDEEKNLERVEQCIDDLKRQLQQAAVSASSDPSSRHYALYEATQQNSKYVHGTNLLLMFLRAENWDVTKACDKMSRFMQIKKESYGIDKLTKDITLDDMDDDDMDMMVHGRTQHVPLKDRSGRRILFAMTTLGSNKIESRQSVRIAERERCGLVFSSFHPVSLLLFSSCPLTV